MQRRDFCPFVVLPGERGAGEADAFSRMQVTCPRTLSAGDRGRQAGQHLAPVMHQQPRRGQRPRQFPAQAGLISHAHSKISPACDTIP